MERVVFAAFLDELEKIAASRGQWTVPQSRSGKRPMTAETLLRKEKDGTLHKDASAATAFTSQDAFPNDSLTPSGPVSGRPATQKRRRHDAPTVDDTTTQPKTESTQINRSTTALVPTIRGDN